MMCNIIIMIIQQQQQSSLIIIIKCVFPGDIVYKCIINIIL